MFNPFRKFKDFASVSESNEIKGIFIPVISLEKYPEIIKRMAVLAEKLSQAISDKEGRPLEMIIAQWGVFDLLKHIPTLIEVAADEFFDFAAFILESDKATIKKLGLVDLARIIRRTFEINEFAEVQDEIQNFMKALTTKHQGK